jgi:hypothetical protein
LQCRRTAYIITTLSDFLLNTDAMGIKVKVKLSLYRPWRLLGLREVEAHTFSDIRLTDGGEVVSPMRRPLFTPRKIPGTRVMGINVNYEQLITAKY